MPRLASVATAVPPHRLAQRAVRDAVVEMVGASVPDVDRLLSVFDHAGVEQRYFARPASWYVEPHGWQDRTDAFLQDGLALAERAAREALDGASLAASDVDGIVFVSSTGVATPSLDARLANRLGARTDVIRLPIWGLGCAGGVAGLARAADLATARPGGRFLLVALELCSLAFLRSRFDKRLLVATALFGDGAAAAVVVGDETRSPGHPWLGAASHQWPATERIMGWDVRDEGLDVVFDAGIPSFLTQRIAAPVRAFVGDRDVHAWALHPGGAKVLEAYRSALGIEPEGLEASRSVLRDYGNMSSPTALFVLRELLARRTGGTVLAGAVGPGFASELALVGSAEA